MADFVFHLDVSTAKLFVGMFGGLPVERVGLGNARRHVIRQREALARCVAAWGIGVDSQGCPHAPSSQSVSQRP